MKLDQPGSLIPAVLLGRMHKTDIALGVSVLLVIIVLPQLLNAYWLSVLMTTFIYATAAIGTSVLYARLGLVSLAQVALVGVGGWVTLRVGFATGLPFEFDMLVGALITGGIGMIIGLPALRMRGLYLALVTLMAASAFFIIITVIAFPNGGPGFLGQNFDNPQMFPRPFLGTSDVAMCRYIMVITWFGFMLAELHRRTAPGRAWAMIRRGDACAMASGVNIMLYKSWAFGLAGFFAGLSGGLMAGTFGHLDANTFPPSQSIMLFALTVVGGAFAWYGQVITGVLFCVAPALLDTFGVPGDLALVIFGAALLHAIITAPSGIAGQIGGLIGLIGAKGGK